MAKAKTKKTTTKTSKAPEKATAKSNSDTTMAKQLALVLSDTYVLAVKTHGYHWNITGPNFSSLHALFEGQYTALIEAADTVAERIRALGHYPDGSMDSFLQNTVIKEAGVKKLTSNAMLKDLHDSYAALRTRLAEAEALSEDLGDVVSQDLLTEQLSSTDKTMWFIQSHIE